MRQIRYILAIVFGLSALLTGEAAAQPTERFIERLSIPSPNSSAWAVVVEKGDVKRIIRDIESRRTQKSVNGYRVRIFFDNSQTARADANQTRDRFRELFPDTPIYIDYENPYWKVTVGDCITNEEAIVLWGQVKNTFDRAFVIRESINIANFGEKTSLK